MTPPEIDEREREENFFIGKEKVINYIEWSCQTHKKSLDESHNVSLS